MLSPYLIHFHISTLLLSNFRLKRPGQLSNLDALALLNEAFISAGCLYSLYQATCGYILLLLCKFGRFFFFFFFSRLL